MIKKKKAILAGDFNIIENIFLDRLGGNPNNTYTIGIQNLYCIKNRQFNRHMEKNNSI